MTDKATMTLNLTEKEMRVNPEHLFAGTHGDNMQDMSAKGRHRSQRGWKQP